MASGTVVTVEGGDHFFAAPDVIEGGLVTMQFRNVGRENHHAQLVRVREDATAEEFGAALQADQSAAFHLVTHEGGAASVGPDLATEVTLDLREVVYALVCVIPSPSDGVRHFAKGMVKPLLVTPPSAAAEPPPIDGTLVLRDFTFDMPETVPAGRRVYRIVNQGPAQPHELAVVRLLPGKTAEDVRQSIMSPGGPPPSRPVGGLQTVEIDGGGYLTLDLEPGEYAVICRVTEPHSGLSHVHLGMVKGFSVR